MATELVMLLPTQHPMPHMSGLCVSTGNLDLQDCNSADIALSLCRMVSYNVAQVRCSQQACICAVSTCAGALQLALQRQARCLPACEANRPCQEASAEAASPPVPHMIGVPQPPADRIRGGHVARSAARAVWRLLHPRQWLHHGDHHLCTRLLVKGKLLGFESGIPACRLSNSTMQD